MKSVCFSIAILFVSTLLFAHTLVLKNGKKIDGTLINEDAESYQIRDSQGIVILVKKSQADAEATSEINKKILPSKPSETKVETKPTPKKKEPVRVLRKEDLDKMPELSIVGTEDTGEEQKSESEFMKAMTEKSEQDWKAETRRFATAIRGAESDVEFLSQRCEELGQQSAYAMYDPQKWILINGVWIPIDGSYPAEVIQQAQQACSQAERAKKELQRLRTELEEFQDYARRQGALPGWVDPDRL